MKEHFESRVHAKRSTFPREVHTTVWERVQAVATLRGRAGTRSPPQVGECPANNSPNHRLGRPLSLGRGTPCRSW
eukprot:5348123-Amphidinium_carterae.1